jgi:hypothetical protein
MPVQTREIGVIGVRRSFIPPLVDSYQDMIFVLYGPKLAAGATEHVADPTFMNELDELVRELHVCSDAYVGCLRTDRLIGAIIVRATGASL